MSEKRLQEAIEYNDKKTDEMIDEIVFTRWIDPTIEEKDKEIERLHSIIKEVREYIEEHTKYKNYGYIDQKQWLDKYFDLRNLKEILEKESKEWDT